MRVSGGSVPDGREYGETSDKFAQVTTFVDSCSVHSSGLGPPFFLSDFRLGMVNTQLAAMGP